MGENMVMGIKTKTTRWVQQQVLVSWTKFGVAIMENILQASPRSEMVIKEEDNK